MNRALPVLLADIYGSIGTSSPAAYDTLCALFRDTRTKPEDYDLIVTGDLGRLGHQIVSDFFRARWAPSR